MPWQLIYTSAPRGLAPGQSGYCTVARSRDLREALVPRLEKLSYYPHEGAPIICAHRILLVRGVAFHVLTRLADAGLDFTKRRSFIAHHLVFDPAEIGHCAPPAEILNRWNGWVNRWEGEPHWIEGAPPFPQNHRAAASFPKSIWVTSGPSFLEELEERGAGWDTTFTNHFQPGDHPDDFAIRAIEPGSEGWDAAVNLGAKPVAFAHIPEIRKPLTVAPAAAEVAKPEAVKAPVTTVVLTRGAPWRAAVAGVVLLIIAGALFFRSGRKPIEREHDVATVPSPVRSIPLPSLDDLFPDKPTWLVALNAANEGPTGPIPEFHTLMQQMQKAELFTKDLRGYIQTNLSGAVEAALLDAKPEKQLLRFSTTNGFGADLFVPAGRAPTARVRAERGEAFAIGIEGSFRVLVVKEPIALPRAFLRVEKESVALDVGLEERVRKMVLPKTAQFALRPMVFEAETKTWRDPVARAEKEFGLAAATTFDSAALRARLKEVLDREEVRLADLNSERAGLASEKEKAVTDFKKQERSNSLDKSLRKQVTELDALHVLAAEVFDELAKPKRFSLLLCQSNVTREIIRFETEEAAP